MCICDPLMLFRIIQNSQISFNRFSFLHLQSGAVMVEKPFSSRYCNYLYIRLSYLNLVLSNSESTPSSNRFPPTYTPALQIQSTQPLSSLSSCCCLRNLRKACRFSTRSLSLANSLQKKSQGQHERYRPCITDYRLKVR